MANSRKEDDMILIEAQYKLDETSFSVAGSSTPAQ
jgi:hypothetical protein